MRTQDSEIELDREIDSELGQKTGGFEQSRDEARQTVSRPGASPCALHRDTTSLQNRVLSIRSAKERQHKKGDQ